MNQINISNNLFQSNNFNFDEFCRNFYTKMTIGGYSQTLYFFDQNAKCSFNNESFNPYNLLLKLSSLNIQRFNYNNINSTYQLTNDGVLINSISIVNPINFFGLYGINVKLSETFLIKLVGNKYYIYNYILKTLD